MNITETRKKMMNKCLKRTLNLSKLAMRARYLIEPWQLAKMIQSTKLT